MNKELKAKILSAEDARIVPVDIIEWDTTVYVKTLTGKELVRFRNYENTELDQDLFLLCLTLCDMEGNLLFTPEEIAELKEKSWGPLAKLIVVSQRLNQVDEASFEVTLKNLGLDKQTD